MPTVNFKYLLASLVILIFAIPSLNQHTLSNHPDLLGMVFGVALIFGLLSLLNVARQEKLGVSVALFTIICAIISIFTELEIFSHLMMIGAVLFFSVGIVVSIFQVFVVRKGVDFNKIIGAVCIYLFIALLWTVLYQFLEILIPGSFNGVSSDLRHDTFNELLYFSFVTLTTLGYGDITPLTPFAKALVIIEVIVGVFYIAILVAALVGDFMSTRLQSKS